MRFYTLGALMTRTKLVPNLFFCECALWLLWQQSLRTGLRERENERDKHESFFSVSASTRKPITTDGLLEFPSDLL